MKTKSKALLLVASAILLVAATVVTTMAFLTDTEFVENTFTVGKVDITLDEVLVDEYGVPSSAVDRVQENEYKLIPGHEYTKDPTIHVADTSEDCWVFAKIETALGSSAILDIDLTKWTQVDGEVDSNAVYAYNEIQSGGADVTVFTKFTFSSAVDPQQFDNKRIKVTAYAIQADGFGTAEKAWTDAKSAFAQ